jgi:diaminopimelate decarboxylase
MEPGRRIVAGCGVILTRVTQIKRKVRLTFRYRCLYVCV